jgi:hypothetical protein
MCGFDEEAKSCKDPSIIELTETLNNWSQMNYYITLCKFVSHNSFDPYSSISCTNI